ncbi:hypothetical protein [Fulvivirga sp.]|uniref:hypothetical protein n=1 Tax=Fulvivirga sp. TaxID=1931237 RepID=UPI0032EBDA2C
MLKITLLLSSLLWLSPVQQKMVKAKIGDYITVELPESFYAMSPQDIAQRYPSVRKPIGAYTNDERLVDFSVNVSATRWRSTDIEIAKDFFKASITNLYDRVDFVKEEIVVINDMRYIVFEFTSRINGDKYSLDQRDAIRTYTYLQYLLINGKTFVFTFNTPVQIKDRWVDIAPQIMNSLKVKKNIE